MAESSKVTLGYWAIRGRATVPRLVCEYAGIAYDEKRYSKPEEWGADKATLGLDFPNLPYLLDGDFKLTETRAIVLYLIRRSGKTDLLGKDLQSQAIQGNVGGVVEDVMKPLSDLCFNKDFNTAQTATWATIEPRLKRLDEFLGKNEWLAGFFSIVDFTFYETWNYVRGIFPTEAATFTNFQAHHDRFEAVPQIKAYIASERNIKVPYLPPGMAQWTGL